MINWEWIFNVHRTRANAKLIKYATIPCVFKTQLTLPLSGLDNHNGYYSDDCLSCYQQVVRVTCHVSCGNSVGYGLDTIGNVDGRGR